MVTVSRPAWCPPWRFLVPFVATHSLASLGLFLVAFGQGMARLDTGGEPTFIERAASSLSKLLLSPLFILTTRSKALRAVFPGLLAYVPLLANSVLWAFLVWWLIAFGRRFMIRDSPRHHSASRNAPHHSRHDA